MDRTRVRLEVHKTFVDGFKSVSLSSSIRTMAHGFAISMIYHEKTEWIKPFLYQQVRLYLDDELLLTGRIENITIDQDKNMQIEGRSLPGSLNECAITGPFQFHNTTLYVMANEIISPVDGYDISVVNGVNDLNVYDKRTAEPDATVFSFLNEMAEQEGVYLSCTEHGALWLRRYEDKTVHYNFKLGEGTYWGASVNYDGAKRFSSLKVLTQQKRGKPLSTTISGGTNTFRPHVAVVEAKDEATLQQIANKRLALNVSDAVKVTFSMLGWPRSTQDNRILRIGDVVVFEDESLGLKEGLWMIETLDLKLGESDFSCSIGLALPALYNKNPSLGALPWL